ncbi:MAG: (Fe-S)-binding protein [Thermodesulfobacteria bacterium]|nr:(Fe-S)-binding protein [Thermodesulfobacteriota bacterium]
MGPEKCARCGKCLSVCPTFQTSRRETFSPRGRVALHQAGLLRGQALSFCLLCGSCEAVCPNQVPVVELVLAAREAHPLTGADLVTGAWEAVLRLGPRFREREELPERGNPVVFLGCGGDFLYPQAVEALVGFLRKKGFSPALPRDQGCCGLFALSLGARSSFLRQARRNLSALAEAEVVITPCASCLYTLKVLYPRYLRGSKWAQLADQVAQKTFEASSFLFFQGFVRKYHYFLFQVPCHLRYISSMKWWYQTKFVIHEGCCGGGGLFGIRFPKESQKILRSLHQTLERQRVHELVTACTSCWLTLKRHFRLPVKMLCEALSVVYC